MTQHFTFPTRKRLIKHVDVTSGLRKATKYPVELHGFEIPQGEELGGLKRRYPKGFAPKRRALWVQGFWENSVMAAPIFTSCNITSRSNTYSRGRMKCIGKKSISFPVCSLGEDGRGGSASWNTPTRKTNSSRENRLYYPAQWNPLTSWRKIN